MWNWLKEILGMSEPEWAKDLSPENRAKYDVQVRGIKSGDPAHYEPPTRPVRPAIQLPQGGVPMEMAAPTPTPVPGQFGIGTEEANVLPELYEAILTLEAIEKEKRDLLELSGQESSYGYAGPHISDVEQSYGPFHINLMAGRIDPTTGQPFTRAGAEDIQNVVDYALAEMRRTGGLGSWNPGAYDFYQNEIPKRAETKRFVRGE